MNNALSIGISEETMRFQLAGMLVVWLMLLGVVFFNRNRSQVPGVSGPLIYVLILSLNHFFGAFVYSLLGMNRKVLI